MCCSAAASLVSIQDSFPTHLQSCTSPQIQQLHAATHGCIISSKVLLCVIFAATGSDPVQKLPDRRRSYASSVSPE